LVALLEKAEFLFELVVLSVESLLSFFEGLSFLLVLLLPKFFFAADSVEVCLGFLLELNAD
jgi:hypothetical protein